jgi:predicted RNA-binding protein with PIN domain
MQYLIDGHNLIPKVGLRLEQPDDEHELLKRLQEFCRLRRARVEVYFDAAAPGFAGSRKVGVVTAHFIRQGASADSAIEARLIKMKRSARNWTVVSSDARVQQSAAAARAVTMQAEEFAIEMSRAEKPSHSNFKPDPVLSPEDVEGWLNIFEKRGR